MKKFLLYLILVVQLLDAQAQDYFFDSYSFEDGLSSKVYSIIQDSTDFIWLGTEDGLFRFDGHEFKRYTSEEHGLASNQITNILYYDKNHMIFGHLLGGLSLYNGKSFSVIKPISNSENYDITDLQKDIDGSVWYGTVGYGIFNINNPLSDTSDMVIANYKGGNIGSLIFDIILNNNNEIVVSAGFVISKYNRDSLRFEKMVFPKTNYAVSFSILQDSEGYYWLGKRNDGLHKYNPVTKASVNFDERDDGLETNIVMGIMEDSKGNIWTRNYDENQIKGGVCRISGNQVTAFNRYNGLPSNLVRSIYEDIQGNILIATLDHGLAIYKGNHIKVFNVENPTTQTEGLINAQVYDIVQDNSGNIWFGTDGGISIYHEGKNREFEHFSYKNTILNNKIRHLIKDQNGEIWIGTNGGGVFKYNRQTRNFSFYPILGIGKYAEDNIVTSMATTQNNILWVGTNSGIAKYYIKLNRDERISRENGINGNVISALYNDPNQRLWVGSQNNGISYTDDYHNFKTLEILKDITPTCFFADTEKNLWVGTNLGIFILKDGYSKYSVLKVEDGLLSNRITSLNSDNDGNIYIGTQLGINKYFASNGKIVSYNKRNGFPGVEAKDNASFKDIDGNLWFGSSQGAVKYIPSLDPISSDEPLTHITEMYINDELTDFSNGMRLSFKQNRITINYTCVDITNPNAVRFKRMLEGLDKDWQSVTTSRSIKYEALPPGKYNFKIKAKNSSGIWNENPVSLSFSIRPPFYQTWWFFTILILVLATAIYIYIHIRERNLIKEKKILEDKVKERTIELSDANAELAMKNKDITDSIQYAKRIQFAILPPEIPFGDTFVLFKPKDIVSGDFYWITQKDDRDYIAAVDCTGHGVPGAFMSFIGYTSLNKIILEKGITKPSTILDELNAEVVNALHQGEDDDVKDGMDMSLISFDNKSRKLEFAGAFNAIYLIRNGELIEYKVDRFAIGRSFGEAKPFTPFEIEIEPGDMVYQFSDGYADQFGGEQGKKFRAKPFKALLTSIADKPVNEQREILDHTIEEWRGDIEQIDDILVIGRRY